MKVGVIVSHPIYVAWCKSCHKIGRVGWVCQPCHGLVVAIVSEWAFVSVIGRGTRKWVKMVVVKGLGLCHRTLVDRRKMVIGGENDCICVIKHR